jgi:hypothetical protein
MREGRDSGQCKGCKRLTISTEIPRKYTLAIRRNCSQRDFGSQVNSEYFVVVMALVRPWSLIIAANVKDRGIRNRERMWRGLSHSPTWIDSNMSNPWLLNVFLIGSGGRCHKSLQEIRSYCGPGKGLRREEGWGGREEDPKLSKWM